VADCLYKIASAENHRRGYSAGIVYADSRAMLRDRVTALRTANIYERHSYRHIVGLPVIGAVKADGITAETPFLVARIMRDGRPASILTVSTTRPAACGSSNVSWSAIAVISIRCLPSRCERTVRQDDDLSGVARWSGGSKGRRKHGAANCAIAAGLVGDVKPCRWWRLGTASGSRAGVSRVFRSVVTGADQSAWRWRQTNAATGYRPSEDSGSGTGG
jgi:hypothetical protein